jgi:hypothetical protein
MRRPSLGGDPPLLLRRQHRALGGLSLLLVCVLFYVFSLWKILFFIVIVILFVLVFFSLLFTFAVLVLTRTAAIALFLAQGLRAFAPAFHRTIRFVLFSCVLLAFSLLNTLVRASGGADAAPVLLFGLGRVA